MRCNKALTVGPGRSLSGLNSLGYNIYFQRANEANSMLDKTSVDRTIDLCTRIIGDVYLIIEAMGSELSSINITLGIVAIFQDFHIAMSLILVLLFKCLVLGCTYMIPIFKGRLKLVRRNLD